MTWFAEQPQSHKLDDLKPWWHVWIDDALGQHKWGWQVGGVVSLWMTCSLYASESDWLDHACVRLCRWHGTQKTWFMYMGSREWAFDRAHERLKSG